MPDYTLDWSNGGTANGTNTLTGPSGTVTVTTTTTTNINGQTASVGNMGTPSAPALFVSGIAEPITSTMTFSEPVENISFEIYDLDFSAGGWDDSLQIIALDANGNQVPILYSDLDGLHSISGDTVNADGSFNSGVETTGAEDSVTVNIPGPISSIQFIFDNGESFQTSGQFGVGNMSIDAAVPDYVVEGGNGDDFIDATYVGDPEGDRVDNADNLALNDDDIIVGGSGNDSISGGAGADEIFGDRIEFDPADYPSGTEGTASSFTFVNTSPVDVQLYWIDTAGVAQPYSVVGAGGSMVQNTFTDHNWVIVDPETGAYLELIGNPADGSTYTFDSAGDDTIDGGAGADTIFGEYGDDVISGMGGQDTIEGGAGDDIIAGDATAPSVASSAGDAGQLFLDVNNVQPGSETGTPGNAQEGDSVIFNNAATLPDGTVVSVKVTVASISDPGVTVDLTNSQSGAPLRVNGNGDPSNAGETVQFTMEFFDQATGLPISIGGQATVTDIDDNGGAGEEFVTFAAGDVTGYTVGPNTSILVDANTDTVGGTGTTANNAVDESAWFGVGFEDKTELTMTVGVVESAANYGFSGQDITGGVTTTVDQGANDSLSGGAGNDVIYGNGGDDVIDGGDDDDTLYGGAGADTITGGNGVDTIIGGADADAIYGGPGDVVDGSEDGVDSDTLYVSGAINIIYDVGNPENGLVQFASGPDLVFSNIENVVMLNDGTVSGTSGDDVINSAFVDSTDGDVTDGGDAIIPGHGPNDDLIEAGAGNDTIDASIGADTVYAGTGNDLIYAGADSAADTVFGEAGNDTMFGFNGNDELYGGDNDDIVDGDGGNDSLYGGSGNDQLIGDAGEDILTAGAGDDTLYAGADNDTLYGGTGNDTQYGDSGDDIFVLENDFGTDTITGGETSETVGDILDASAVTTNLTLDLSTLQPANPETGTLSDGVNTATFDEIEYVFLGTGDDSVTGSSGADNVAANEGEDTINLGAGDDQLDLGQSGGGADGDADVIILQDGFGNDTILNFDAPTPQSNGTFTGIDTFDVSGLTDAGGAQVNTGDVTVTDDGSGNAVLTFPNGETVTLIGIDPLDADDPAYLNAIGIPLSDGTVSGTSGNDTIGASYIGDPDGDRVDANDAILPGDTGDDDLIEAGAGDDNIYSGNGNDEVYGEAGNDLIQNGGGNSTLYGGADDDTILSGGGNDTVFGGSGNDSVGASIGSDEVYGGSGNDSLSAGGFAGAGDTLDGGADDDTLTGGLGDDTLIGGTGDDRINVASAAGTDTITGGEDLDGLDIDTLNFIDATGPDGVRVVLDGAESGDYASISQSGDGSFIEIERFELTEQDDEFLGGASTSATTVFGGAGSDDITGGEGDDVLDGGADADTFIAQDNFGNDTVIGGQTGDNFDTLDLSGLSNPVTVLFSGPGAGTVTDTVTGDVLTFSEIEFLITTNQSDTIDATNDNGYTYINTLAGDDTYTGSAGNDIADDEMGTPDGAGNDTFFGGAGDDQIWAGNDDDTLFGGTGADSLNGQEGDDTITFAEGDTASGDGGDDLFILEDLGEPSNGTITIDGGAGGETGGDTLQLGTLANLTQAVRDTFVDDGTGSYAGTVTLDDGTILNFSEIENIICFTTGTRIATPRGLINVEDLTVGDLVVTRDHGLQPIRWIEARSVPGRDRFAPVRISKNVLAGQDRDLVVSPQHRVLFQGYRAELLFGVSEVLVSAKHLIDGIDVMAVEQPMVTYVHMLFDQHEIIFSEGAASESFHPGDVGFSAVAEGAREELFSIFPNLRVDPSQYGASARRSLKAHEAKLIRL